MSQIDQFNIGDLFCKVVHITTASVPLERIPFCRIIQLVEILKVQCLFIEQTCIKYVSNVTQALCQAGVPAGPGVHSLEAGDRHAACFVALTAGALRRRAMAEIPGGCPTLPVGSETTSLGRILAQSCGMNKRGLRSGRPCGEMTGVADMSLCASFCRGRERRKGGVAGPGSHSCSEAVASLLGSALSTRHWSARQSCLTDPLGVMEVHVSSTLWLSLGRL